MPLKEVLLSIEEERLKVILSSFVCGKDLDIQNFLHNKAIDFEKTSKARTYLMLNADSLEEDKIEMLAYFTLALKVLKISENR